MNIHFRFAQLADADLYFLWTNDELVRKNSFNQLTIPYEEHLKWFTQKVQSPFCYLYLFLNELEIPVGQVRIDKGKEEVVIGVSIDEKFRGKSLGKEMLSIATTDYLNRFPHETIVAYIKQENITSNMIFEKAGFKNPLPNHTESDTFKLFKSKAK